jgi:two-component system, LytTR family, sensor histidine kinase AlgZ
LSRESISQAVTPSATAASAARVPAAGDVLDDMIEEAPLAIDSPVPDWCNLGLTLRIVVALNLLFFCVAALSATTFVAWSEQWLGLAIVVEPVLIASLLFGCLLRRLAWRLTAPLQFAIPLVLPALLTIVAQKIVRGAGPIDLLTQWRDPLFAALIAGAVLYWARLRERAYSPALAEAQLQALQSRIRPHFLFNSLNAALGLIRSDPRRAETVLEDIADLFRVLMRDSGERVPLASEIALCKQYLAIEQLRLGDRLTATWHVDEGTNQALVPTLLLQPLIENAVHHGIEPSVASGSIDIDVTRVGRYVDIVVANPWLGEASAAATRGNRIGLDNVRQRLGLVHDLEATIDTTVRGDRYVVHVRFPAERRRTPRGGRPTP